MNLTEDEKKRLFQSLERLEESQYKTNQALFGDKAIGLDGVMDDVKSLKHWRNELALKTSYLAGIIAVVTTAALMFGKYVVYKITGKNL